MYRNRTYPLVYENKRDQSIVDKGTQKKKKKKHAGYQYDQQFITGRKTRAKTTTKLQNSLIAAEYNTGWF